MMHIQTTDIDELSMHAGEGVLLADGFEDAFIGIASRFGWIEPVAVYDFNKCIEIIMGDCGDDCDFEGALEYFHYNVIGAWVGEQTPIFVAGCDLNTLQRHYEEQNHG
jgi:hypothetical protein